MRFWRDFQYHEWCFIAFVLALASTDCQQIWLDYQTKRVPSVDKRYHYSSSALHRMQRHLWAGRRSVDGRKNRSRRFAAVCVYSYAVRTLGRRCVHHRAACTSRAACAGVARLAYKCGRIAHDTRVYVCAPQRDDTRSRPSCFRPPIWAQSASCVGEAGVVALGKFSKRVNTILASLERGLGPPRRDPEWGAVVLLWGTLLVIAINVMGNHCLSIMLRDIRGLIPVCVRLIWGMDSD